MVAPPTLYICFSHNHPRVEQIQRMSLYAVGHPQPCINPGAQSIFYSFAGAPVGVYRIASLHPSCLSYHTRTVLLYTVSNIKTTTLFIKSEQVF